MNVNFDRLVYFYVRIFYFIYEASFCIFAALPGFYCYKLAPVNTAINYLIFKNVYFLSSSS